jgi:hypothetical protein
MKLASNFHRSSFLFIQHPFLALVPPCAMLSSRHMLTTEVLLVLYTLSIISECCVHVNMPYIHTFVVNIKWH